MADIPYVGWTNETLNKLPEVKEGDSFLCPDCGQQHVLRAPRKPQYRGWVDQPEKPPFLLYECGSKSRVGATNGRLVVGVRADISSNRAPHSICSECYVKQQPGEIPTRLKNPKLETCCFCGQLTDDGIYIAAGAGTLCKEGDHDR